MELVVGELAVCLTELSGGLLCLMHVNTEKSQAFWCSLPPGVGTKVDHITLAILPANMRASMQAERKIRSIASLSSSTLTHFSRNETTVKSKQRSCSKPAEAAQRVDLLEVVLPELRDEDEDLLLLDRLPLDRLGLRPRAGRRGGEAAGFCVCVQQFVQFE